MAPLTSTLHCSHRLDKAADYILNCQLESGAIPWFDGGRLDPWDHTEAAMALSIAGHTHAAKKAYEWLAKNQNTDGSWYSSYFSAPAEHPLDVYKVESNFIAYPATGLWHYYLITQDKHFVLGVYPSIKKAIDLIVSWQSPDGDILWAKSDREILPKDALVTGCSSVLRSLESAINLAELAQDDCSDWRSAYHKLFDAIKNKPWRFDRTWESKARFSMDWFYPILSGAFSIRETEQRLTHRWNEFYENGVGCRCVSDEPWMTVAESCELTIALISANKTTQAKALYNELSKWQDKDGGYWTGYSFRDNAIWPEEKTTWTAGAVLLAADALFNITPAAQLFTIPGYVQEPDNKTL